MSDKWNDWPDFRSFMTWSLRDDSERLTILNAAAGYIRRMCAQRIASTVHFALEEAELVGYEKVRGTRTKQEAKLMFSRLTEHAHHPHGTLFNELEKTNKRGGSKRRASLKGLLENHDRVLSQWQDASRFCLDAIMSSSAERHRRWITDIKDPYPDLAGEDDLILRLQPYGQWSENIANEVPDQHRTNNSEIIALEHASRLCWPGKYKYKPSYLRRVLSSQRTMKESFIVQKQRAGTENE